MDKELHFKAFGEQHLFLHFPHGLDSVTVSQEPYEALI